MKQFISTLSIILLITISAFAQKETPRDKAVRYFTNGAYSQSLPLLLSYSQQKPKDNEIKYLIGVCYFRLGQAARAQQFLQELTPKDPVAGEKPPLETYYYLAKAHHYQQHYEEAVKYYKLALGVMKSDDPKRPDAKNDIQRCLRGSKLLYAEQLAYCDNLGDIINTDADEYAPVVGTNAKNEDVLLFSAIRSDNIGGKRDAQNKPDEVFGTAKSDIFITEQDKGEWVQPQRQDTPYSSEGNDQILDLSEDGVFLYIGRATKTDPGALFYAPYLDDSTNTSLKEPAKLLPEPINMKQTWEGDSYFFRDSILVLSSDRPGGYGGRDIYISQRNTNGVWTELMNLGPVINTPFDEVSPFLAKDGRTLYYSSNNLTSIGGLDVFKATFIDTAKAFTAPVNMGLPINSPADDRYFRITKDGNRAYLSSDRMGSKGGTDLYVAYFKGAVTDMRKTSTPSSFIEFLSKDLKAEGGVSVIRETPVILPEEARALSANVKISPMLYNESVMTLIPTNANQLNTLAVVLQKFPKAKLEFTAHTHDDGIRNFALYFAAKRLDELASYLMQKGITPDRILMRSVGMSYPIAQNKTPDGTVNDVGRSLNQRVEVRILGYDPTKMTLEEIRPKMSEQLAIPDGEKFRKEMEGLVYKVQVKATKTMFDDAVLIDNPSAMIETTYGAGMFRYTVGLHKNFAEATVKLKTIATRFPDAFIVAYLNGQRVTQEQIPDLVATYPDLKNLIKEKE